MRYFAETSDTIVKGAGFQHFGGLHSAWLGMFLAVVVLNILYVPMEIFRRFREKV